MDSTLYESLIEKYSMGRSTGLRAKNWKTRCMRVSRSRLSVYEKENVPIAKFEIPTVNISIVFANPDRSVHPEASGTYVKNMIAIRLFDNGAYTLLIRAHTEEDKACWLKALKEAVAKVKGCQFVE